MTCEHWKRCGDCHSPALVEGLRKIEDDLRDEVARLQAALTNVDNLVVQAEDPLDMYEGVRDAVARALGTQHKSNEPKDDAG